MTFIDKITGNDMTRDYRQMQARVELLPLEYQQAWDQIFAKLGLHTNFTGRNLTPLYNGVLDMLEEMNALGRSIEDVFGGDLEGFCAELTSDQPSFDVRDKWRKRLNKKIERRFK